MMSSMPFELSVLVWSAALLFILIVIYANANVSAMGMQWGIGNRDEGSTAAGAGPRAKRAASNLIENLLIYACLVIPAHLTGIHTNLTVLGAELFLIGRIAHALVYTTGLTFLGIRTIAWAVAVIGYLIIFYEIVTF
ncbi:putative MAPEG superfamily protein [Parvibaculum indicum]|uniref:MAPEG family protein n=1 Tax=Parvibaculum indicum TaxID=562969 RepID=UPI0014218116|nr:MAPEG family protein [Parvibaculum indicum]NIJ40446.1 putative MAPEG superfamily protein [Parvibaculum indicum]